MKIAIRLISLVFLGLFSLQATAERVTLYYADGTIAEREAQISQPDTGIEGGDIVTLDSRVLIREIVTFTEIFTVTPGQEVNVSAFFNSLGSLEVPFEQLVGRTMATRLIARRIGLSRLVTVTIEEGDENVIGYGVGHTVPIETTGGLFRMFGRNNIAGLNAVNNTGAAVRNVAAP